MNPPDDAITALCQRYRALILQHDADRLRVAVAESVPPGLSESLHFASQCQIDIECWPQARLDQRQHADTGRVAREETPAESAIEAAELILRQALERRASDVHIEPGAEGMRVRLRIDGVLHPLSSLPVTQPGALLARLKILGGLDIAERRLPQDGQFSLAIAGQSASFRLATLPVYGGEKAVIRLLQSESAALSLDKLGLPPAQLRLFTAALAQPQGLILVTGPTGSGKTFTLYSGLSALNRPEKNLCSVEDPIEIPLSGINQTQIHNRKGLDFNRVLRALLRQDPDVIMVGEIRDAETAEIAVKAAQTGHLVLSTLHTNSTAETLTRLRQMGIPGYLLGPALKLIVAQRLVRRLCPHCRQPAQAVAHYPTEIWPGTLQTWRAPGCDHCFSGYFGRLALFELLPINARLQNAIAAEMPLENLLTLAKQQGLRPLLVSGLEAVSRGDTSLEEMQRVIGLDDG
ncbi:MULTISPECIES: type II secretion system protein GspE [Pantoea]|uniref:type II secretion system protein GspE n=1 Tax=Pantoea TaxID=53335 RepID=UPI00123250AF|nr:MULTISPECIES: type II secretion system protein GspE [Pantoea]KAF6657450.1 type II secretion system protein GspE [Enterobacteriaceae bacterium EKM102V]KAA5974702.1 type II secretion system protein GspE [Pantoea sp. M_8]KAA5975924.1 type II secretion system protein GspE [Pantoea sp. M_6]KAA5991003.1 type II secretion system protein GspE [Pantoea sp. M_10]KAA5995250.1 type II secretion system protein GspE [Pantoea sp. M_5]